MKRLSLEIYVATWLLLHGTAALAGPKFSVASGVNFKDLADSGRIEISSMHKGDFYQVDASAVLPVEAARFLDATLNFERYVSIGMDHVNEAHCIGGDCQANPLVFWMKLGALGVSSKSYGQLYAYRSLDPATGAMGATWHQIGGQPSWGYADSPKFKGMEGSLYVLPLGESRPDGARGTYIRYVAGATVDVFLPGSMIETFASHEMRVNITSFVRKLAEAARGNPQP
jgi:hypothetical protein